MDGLFIDPSSLSIIPESIFPEPHLESEQDACSDTNWNSGIQISDVLRDIETSFSEKTHNDKINDKQSAEN